MNKNQKRWIFLFFLMSIALIGFLQVPRLMAYQTQPDERYIGEKTFIRRNGVWIDSEYQPAVHPIYQVGLQSDAYSQFLKVYPYIHRQRFTSLSAPYLIVLDGWAIEVVDGLESGPLVASEKRTPPFIVQVEPREPIIRSYTVSTTDPVLLATMPAKSCIYVNFHMSWGELIGVSVVGILLGIGIWQNRKEAVARTRPYLAEEE
ncbi:MAG: hypothetical protein AAF490_09485 [Chloroflexota bacterium]